MLLSEAFEIAYLAAEALFTLTCIVGIVVLVEKITWKV